MTRTTTTAPTGTPGAAGPGAPARVRARALAAIAVIGALAALAAVPPAQALPAARAQLVAASEGQVRPAAASPCGPEVNAIACENRQLGTDPSVWDIEGAGDPSIQGFATDISVDAGGTVDFKIDTDAADYTIDIYRTGWYQGLGARHVAEVEPSASLPQAQPECVSDIPTELYDCGTWAVSASWQVPADAVSGVYIASLARTDTGGQSHIIFIVRDDASTSDIVFQTSDTTWQAYNSYGGSDFYQGAGNGRAYQISYNRPFNTRQGVTARDFYFSSEYATVRFLERNGYDITYLAGVDSDRRGEELLGHRVFLSVGHDEYWSGAQRANVEKARDAGVNLQFLSGNEVYWRTRWEASADGSNTPYRTLVSYKETWADEKIDPSHEWTGTWRDPRLATAEQGGHSPENALTGTIYVANHSDLPVTVSREEARLRLWRHTGLDAMTADSTELAPHTVGYESDEVMDNGYSPGGLIRLSTTVGPTPEYLTDYGNTVVEGTTRHHLTLYRAASDALVFSAGSVQWGWGLDAEHDGNGADADPRMQQAQVNLLADMDAQPTTLMDELVATTASADQTPPVTTIDTPEPGASLAHGSVVTVTGTASDAEGVVAAVEVSTDEGRTWFAATGTTEWSYSYVQQGLATAGIRARAIDDSANFSPEGAQVALAVTGPSSVLGDTTPQVASVTDDQSIELGMRFTATVDGAATGVRLFQGERNTGSHTGSLWSARGQRLAQVSFPDARTGEAGWRSALFDQPVELVAGRQYTVSYTAPRGGYAYEPYYWPYKARSSAPLEAVAGTGSAVAGVFGFPGSLPTRTHHDSAYFVDVVFEAAAVSPVRLSALSPSADAHRVPTASAVTATFTRPVVPASVTATVASPSGEAVAGTLAYAEATRTLRFAPAAPLEHDTAYTVTIGAEPVDGGTFEPEPWTFTTAALVDPDSVCPCTVHDDADVPAIPTAGDTAPVTVGTAFEVSEAGFITGMRYYRGAGNVGPHVGTLWGPGEEQLASVVFSGETATGWQTAAFDAAVAVQPGATYVIAYRAPAGGYAVTPGLLADGLTRGPVSVPERGGSFTYGSGFPGQRSTSGYFVDPVFERVSAGPALVAATPAPGSVDVEVGVAVSARFAEPLVGPSAPDITVRAGGNPLAGEVTLSDDRTTATFSPAQALPYDTDIAVSVSGATSESGTAPRRGWSFRTAADPATAATATFFGEDAPPGAGAGDDGAALELGMRLSTAVAGRVTGIRFFKAAGDTGVHTGTLWDQDGRVLTSVRFDDETPSGWQRAQLAVPVEIEPGRTYTVSYHSPQGRYVYASGGFSSPISSGPLTAPATGNGVFRGGAERSMPELTWNATNYFVDVDFTAGTDTAPAVMIDSRSPEGADAPADGEVVAVLSADAPAPTLELERDGAAVAGEADYTPATRTVRFVAASALAPATTYRVTARVGGQVLDAWEFTTAPPDLDGVVQTLFGDAEPETASAADATAVTVGTAFEVAYPGWATAIRFYKGPANSGTHVGRLWGPDGEPMAEVTFGSETESGWQRAPLSTPVELLPGQTYTVSYFAPVGGYAVTPHFFDDAVVAGHLSAPAQVNGRFVYGPDGSRPTTPWQASAYFVDAEVSFGQQPPASAGPSAAAAGFFGETPFGHTNGKIGDTP